MIITTLSEIIWVAYQVGRVNASKQTFRQEDILQMCKLALGSDLRRDYYNSKKLDEYGMPDMTDISAILSIQRFKLPTSETNMRRADMSAFDLYRMPHNSHVVNIYPIGACDGNDSGNEITLVEPGEENFYRNNPDFDFFQFGVMKGRGVNTYNVPPCVEYLDIESSFDTDSIDVSLDVAFDISMQVLGNMLRIPDYMGKQTDNAYLPPMKNLKQKLSQQQEQDI